VTKRAANAHSPLASPTAPNGPVAVCTPSGRDAEMVARTLMGDGIQTHGYAGMAGLCAALEAGAEVGIVAEEALLPDAVRLLTAMLDSLPAWSDPPLIVLGAPNRDASAKLFTELAGVANLTLVERPTRPFTLLAVVRSALRSRARQHETKLLLEEVQASREELARHRDELAEAVRRRTEELQSVNAALRLSERMAAIGTLSAGIGHDIANLLLPVRVHIDALEQINPVGVSGPHMSVSDHIPAIRACINHLQRLSAGLRQMALDPEDDGAAGAAAEDTDLADWWLTAEPVIRNTLPKGVRLESDITPGLRVAIAQHQLSQAIVNLVQNAGDAIASKGGKPSGRVLVWGRPGRDGAPPLTQENSRTWGVWPGEDRVRIGVTDDGPGMTDEVRRRCLEPLFTTKTRRLSTGLGLVLVKGIVQRAGGELTIQSEDDPASPRRGTTFTLCMPIPAAARGSRPRAAVTVRDPRFRGFISSTLKSLGYEPEPHPPEELRVHEAPCARFTGAGTEGRAVGSTTTADSASVDLDPLGDASLWVTDPDVAPASAFRRFTESGSGRRVLVLGPGREASVDQGDAPDPRILDFPERPGPTQLRQALSHLCGR
jgi:signal transduction histidine kinase